MGQKEILDFITQNESKMTANELWKALRAKGFSEAEINEAIAGGGKEAAPSGFVEVPEYSFGAHLLQFAGGAMIGTGFYFGVLSIQRFYFSKWLSKPFEQGWPLIVFAILWLILVPGLLIFVPLRLLWRSLKWLGIGISIGGIALAITYVNGMVRHTLSAGAESRKNTVEQVYHKFTVILPAAGKDAEYAWTPKEHKTSTDKETRVKYEWATFEAVDANKSPFGYLTVTRMAGVSFAGPGGSMSSMTEPQIAEAAIKNRTDALDKNLADGGVWNPPRWERMKNETAGKRTLYPAAYAATGKLNPPDHRSGHLWMILAPPMDPTNQTVYVVIYEETSHPAFRGDPLDDALHAARTLQIIEEPKPRKPNR